MLHINNFIRIYLSRMVSKFLELLISQSTTSWLSRLVTLEWMVRINLQSRLSKCQGFKRGFLRGVFHLYGEIPAPSARGVGWGPERSIFEKSLCSAGFLSGVFALLVDLSFLKYLKLEQNFKFAISNISCTPWCNRNYCTLK